MAVYPRLLLVLEDRAQATVVVEYRGQGRYLNAPVAELALARARCWTITRFRKKRRRRSISAASGVKQERDSQTRLHLLSFGGQLARTDLETPCWTVNSAQLPVERPDLAR
jgi:Fe-S cluster assembly protein SufD